MVQELQRDRGQSLRLIGKSTAATVVDDGCVPYWSELDGKFVSGPSGDEIANAQGYAADAATEKTAAEAARDLAQAWAESASAPAGGATASAKTWAEAASADAVAAQNSSAAASSSADAANTSLLALGNALANDLGAFSVDADGHLLVTYNGSSITDIEIGASGHLNITYTE